MISWFRCSVTGLWDKTTKGPLLGMDLPNCSILVTPVQVSKHKHKGVNFEY